LWVTGSHFLQEDSQRFKKLLPHAKGPLWVTGSHFLQEDSPQEICNYILDFLHELDQGSQP